jgi:peroxiredoxin
MPPPQRPAPSVNQLLADLHAYRLQTMAKEDLQVNIDQRQLLEDTADRAAFIKAGDTVGLFSLPEVHGGTVELESLLATGPVVLLFFRYAGCPACNIALRHYQAELYPALRDLGATLVAVSPQVPGKLAEIKNRFGFGFPVASDTGNGLARRFGITFTASPASQARARAKGGDLGAALGTGSWELPMPTIVVIGRDRVVRFAEVSPDWLVRAEAQPVIDAVRALAPVPGLTVPGLTAAAP